MKRQKVKEYLRLVRGDTTVEEEVPPAEKGKEDLEQQELFPILSSDAEDCAPSCWESAERRYMKLF